MICLIVFIVGIGAVASVNGADSMEHYAHGFEIEVVDQSPIYELTLTREIYTASVKRDLSDVAVFNKAGEQVPTLLKRAHSTESGAHDRWTSLPIFPVGDDRTGVARDITIESNGTLVRIPEAIAPSEDASVYIIDASGVSAPTTELDLSFDGKTQSVTATLALDSSTKLGQWQPLISKFRVAKLEYEGHALRQTNIKLPSHRAHYYRLRRLAGDTEFSLHGITAKSAAKNAAKTTLLSFNPTGETKLDEVIEFDLGAHFPIESIALSFPANNLFNARLASRASFEGKWRNRYQGIFYALDQNGLLLRPKALALAGVSDRYWRLNDVVPIQNGSFKPSLDVAWDAHRLLFLAQGEGPYVLAAGRANMRDDPAPHLRSLAEMVRPELVGVARVAKQITLGGVEQLQERKVVPWQRIMLWGVLIIGAGILGLMVFRLARQLNQ